VVSQVVSKSELGESSEFLEDKPRAKQILFFTASWCGPCVSSMKSKLAQTKKATDSLGIPIKYNAILYSPNVESRDSVLVRKAYENGIDVYHISSSNPLTQKIGINSDFKTFRGFEKKFAVPRILLINKEGELIRNSFPLLYNPQNYIQVMKTQFPEYFKD
jgi:thiol-disulfide isomerase/thioredoxin